MAALRSAQNHIKQDSPKLAISVYHKLSDIYEIPNFIMNINPNYNFYLRHYEDGVYAYDMYAIPK